MDKSKIFILKIIDTGEIFADYKSEIEDTIKYYEETGKELPFETIASIKVPVCALSPDFSSRLIEFLDPNLTPDQRLLDACVIAVVNLIF